MYNLINKYMAKLTRDDVNNFAVSKNVYLNDCELDFTYQFIKKNWASIIKNPELLNLDHYKAHYSEENFVKIKKIFKEYSAKYQSLLR